MAFRKVPHEDKVKAVQEYLRSRDKNVKEIAEKYGISEATLRRRCNKAISRIDLIIPGGPLDEWKKKRKELKQRFFPWLNK